MTTDAISTSRANRWSIALWVAQVLLALVYLMAGGMKVLQPMDALASMGMGYVTSFPAGFIRFVGTMEILGAIGLILPTATRILPVLTPVAAVGLSVLQICAMVLHVTRGEAVVLPANLVLLAAALFVAWGRFNKAPIHSR